MEELFAGHWLFARVLLQVTGDDKGCYVKLKLRSMEVNVNGTLLSIKLE